MTAPTFLVSSAGRRGELVSILREVVQARGGDGAVLTADMSQLVPAAYLGDGHLVVPPCTHPDFVDVVLALCRERGVTDVIPTIDPELPVYAAARERFAEDGVRVWVSSPELVAICSDKRASHAHLEGAGVPVPRQWAAADIAGIPPQAFPLIAKPAQGSASEGVIHVARPSDAQVLAPTQDYVVEEVANGEEFTVDAMFDQSGTLRASVIRRRIAVRAGEVSKAITVDDLDLTATVAAVAASLVGAYGLLNVQIFGGAGVPAQVIEINARVGGGFPLAWAAGSQMPLWLVQEAAGEVPDARLEARAGMVMLRYDSSVFLTEDQSRDSAHLSTAAITPSRSVVS